MGSASSSTSCRGTPSMDSSSSRRPRGYRAVLPGPCELLPDSPPLFCSFPCRYTLAHVPEHHRPPWPLPCLLSSSFRSALLPSVLLETPGSRRPPHPGSPGSVAPCRSNPWLRPPLTWTPPSTPATYTVERARVPASRSRKPLSKPSSVVFSELLGRACCRRRRAAIEFDLANQGFDLPWLTNMRAQPA